MRAGMRASAVGTLVAVGLCAGCGGSAPSTAAAHPATPTWTEVSAGLRPRLEPSSANPCQRGDLRCFDIVLAEVNRRARALVAACDHNAMFAVTYEETTAAIRAAARAGRFKNRPLLALFTAWFARMYFQAFDAWRAGRYAAVPESWQVAFRAADERTVTGIGDMLLGMNAHITHDLPYVVAEIMPGPSTSVNPDYAFVSQIITASSPSTLRDLGNHLDASVALGRIPLELGGAGTFGDLVAQWRTESWRNGVELRDAAPAQRAGAEQQISTTADVRAALIRAATAYLPLIESSAPRDAFCAAHR